MTTSDTQLEQLFIDLIKLDSAVTTNACAVNHIQDNESQKAYNYIIASATGTMAIYPSLPYLKTDVELITGTRVIENDESGSKRDALYSAVQTIARNIINAGTADYAEYGIAIDGCTEQPSTDGKDDTHIFKTVKLEINYRIIPVVHSSSSSNSSN